MSKNIKLNFEMDWGCYIINPTKLRFVIAIHSPVIKTISNANHEQNRTKYTIRLKVIFPFQVEIPIQSEQEKLAIKDPTRVSITGVMVQPQGTDA